MTRKAEFDLLPCPFCGGEARVIHSDISYSVRCSACGIGIFRPRIGESEWCAFCTKEEAAEAWNRRA